MLPVNIDDLENQCEIAPLVVIHKVRIGTYKSGLHGIIALAEVGDKLALEGDLFSSANILLDLGGDAVLVLNITWPRRSLIP